MKKVFLLLTFTTLITFLFMSSAKAVEVTVTCTPEVISYPGGTTTITVTSDEGGIGFIKVIQPNGESSIVGIRITRGGGSISKEYPDDFPGGSTMQLGEYTVKTSLLGFIWIKCFRVAFFVIPESPFGIVMATTASLGAFIGLVAVKRLRTKRWSR